MEPRFSGFSTRNRGVADSSGGRTGSQQTNQILGRSKAKLILSPALKGIINQIHQESKRRVVCHLVFIHCSRISSQRPASGAGQWWEQWFYFWRCKSCQRFSQPTVVQLDRWYYNITSRPLNFTPAPVVWSKWAVGFSQMSNNICEAIPFVLCFDRLTRNPRY